MHYILASRQPPILIILCTKLSLLVGIGAHTSEQTRASTDSLYSLEPTNVPGFSARTTTLFIHPLFEQDKIVSINMLHYL